MKKKINLNQLKVKSFVTEVEKENKLKGGIIITAFCFSRPAGGSRCLNICEVK